MKFRCNRPACSATMQFKETEDTLSMRSQKMAGASKCCRDVRVILRKNRHLRLPITTPALLRPFHTRPDRVRRRWRWRRDPVQALLGALVWGDLRSFAGGRSAPFVFAVWSLALAGCSLAFRTPGTHAVREHAVPSCVRSFVSWLGVLPATEHLRIAVLQPYCSAAV